MSFRNIVLDRLSYLGRLAIANIYFSEIEIYGKENLLENELTIFVSNHRNGAIDGYVLMKALSEFKAIVGNNLTKSLFLKLFFGGHIEIFRTAETDKERAFNQKQLKKAAELVKANKRLLVFPEGTSKLGPSLLPIKKGAAFICKTLLDTLDDKSNAAKTPISCKQEEAALHPLITDSWLQMEKNTPPEAKNPVYVIPIGLHYEAGCKFRSRVEIHIGKPMLIREEDSGSLTKLTNMIKGGLQEVTANFEDSSKQQAGEAIATLIRNFDKSFSHLEICRIAASKTIPEKLIKEYEELNAQGSFALYQGAPLVRTKNIWLSRLSYCLFPVSILLGFVLNIIPLTVSFFISKKMADDTNVITLWRILVGTPLLVLQLFCYLVISLVLFKMQALGLLAGYTVISWIGLYVFDKWRSLRVVLKNIRKPQRKNIISFSEKFIKWAKE